MTKTLDDVGEAIGKAVKRFDAIVQRRADVVRKGGFTEWKREKAAHGIDKKNRNIQASRAIWQSTLDLERQTGFTLVKDPAMRGAKSYHSIRSGGKLGQ
jgi:putative SOS response-associated peptidase YedK